MTTPGPNGTLMSKLPVNDLGPHYLILYHPEDWSLNGTWLTFLYPNQAAWEKDITRLTLLKVETFIPLACHSPTVDIEVIAKVALPTLPPMRVSFQIPSNNLTQKTASVPGCQPKPPGWCCMHGDTCASNLTCCAHPPQ